MLYACCPLWYLAALLWQLWPLYSGSCSLAILCTRIAVAAAWARAVCCTLWAGGGPPDTGEQKETFHYALHWPFVSGQCMCWTMNMKPLMTLWGVSPGLESTAEPHLCRGYISINITSLAILLQRYASADVKILYVGTRQNRMQLDGSSNSSGYLPI